MKTMTDQADSEVGLTKYLFHSIHFMMDSYQHLSIIDQFIEPSLQATATQAT